MGKVKQLRETELLVGGTIAFWPKGGTIAFWPKTGREPVEVTLEGIPGIWFWDDCGRDAAEYWTLIDYFSQHFEYSEFRILAYWSSPKREN